MLDLSKYDYNLPEELLANRPAEPRDSSRLFIYDTATDEVIFDIFKNISKYLSKDAFLVFNNTKVLPARVILKKEAHLPGGRGGGKIEVLFLINEFQDGDEFIRGISNSKVDVGQRVSFPDGSFLKVVDQKEYMFTFKPEFNSEIFPELFYRYGTTPVPKYIGNTNISEDELRYKYQTIFAKKPASIAAPTASLHFTEKVLSEIKNKGLESAFVTLNVGLGTFAPITEMNINSGKLHKEFYEISSEDFKKIKHLKEQNKKLIAVGTTSVRALESADFCSDKKINSTDIFIYPPYNFKMVGGLITNFHIPKSSLMCLVEAFLHFKGAKKSLVQLYEIAIKEKFRFYSFGDSMLIL